ncbi:uncharacterized protein LOC144118917 isoform X1 [Amblyomma americanum]
MGKRAIRLFVLGLSLLQLFTGLFAEKCEKKFLRRLGLTGHVHACWYFCKGFIPKIGYESDGTPCTKFFRPGACKYGDCVTDVPPDPTLRKPSGPGGVSGRRGSSEGGPNSKSVEQPQSKSTRKKVPPFKRQTQKYRTTGGPTNVNPPRRFG